MSNQPNHGPIQRKGTFLWQEDSPSGAGMNLWSGLLQANNGYPEEHALRAAALFEAASDLLEALTHAVEALEACQGEKLRDQFPLTLAEAHAAIRKATGES